VAHSPLNHHSLGSYSSFQRPPISTPFPYTTLFRSVSMPPRLLAKASGMSNRPGCTPVLAAKLTTIGSMTATVPVLLTNAPMNDRSEEHTSELQSRENLVCRLLLEKKKNTQ